MQSLFHRLVAVAIFVMTACQATPPLYPPTAPPEIREACELTERRCTACHERDRIVYARHSPDEWRTIIERMRQIPGNSIAPHEIDTILECLVRRANSSDLSLFDHKDSPDLGLLRAGSAIGVRELVFYDSHRTE